MKTRRLTKKYKNKSNSKNKKNNKSRKIKNKSRKRILKGGVRSSIGVVIRRTSGRASSVPSIRPSSIRPSSIRPSSVRPSSIRPSSRAGISKPSSNCCDPKPISDQEKLLDNINDFPESFNIFYNSLLNDTTPDKLASIIASIKQEYIKKTTLQPEGAYLNINGLKLVNFLRSKYKNSKDPVRKKIEKVISLLDQYGMSQGVRTSDLEVIKKHVDSRYFECYKELYEDVHAKLFTCGNNNCVPVSTSNVTRGCSRRLEIIYE